MQGNASLFVINFDMFIGFDYWVNLQNTTLPEVTVVGGFIASPEYHDRFLP
jgi:hypothetical protein